MTVDYTTSNAARLVLEQEPFNVAATMGTVGYAAFALIQPIPLSEIVPFQTVQAAFEAEAISLGVSPPVVHPAVAVDTADPFTAPAQDASYAAGGYRPPPDGPMLRTENQMQDPFVVPFSPPAADPVADDIPFGKVNVSDSPAEGFADEVADQPEVELEPAPAPEPVVNPYTAGGYATNLADGDSRARQVLDELSFLFDEN